jgi:flagellar hook-length control protein FliK
LENLPALRERLAGQEIRIERFDVDVRREGGEQSQNRAAQERPGDQTEGRRNYPERQADHQERPVHRIQSLAPNATQLDPDGLDVVI